MNDSWRIEYQHGRKKYFLDTTHTDKHLTQREAEVMCYIHGNTYSDIAKILNLSKRTIELYVKNIMVKLNCSSKKQLQSLVSYDEIKRLEKTVIKFEAKKYIEN